jgi:thioredoxin 1
MMQNVTAVTDATFEQDVLKADAPVLVDFWAPWCGPCRMVGPVLEKVAELYAGRVRVVKVNVDENQMTSQTYGIRSIPTVALFVGGDVVDGVLGAAPLPFFTDMLDKHLKTNGTKPADVKTAAQT